MGKDIYDAIKPESEAKVVKEKIKKPKKEKKEKIKKPRKPINKDTLVISIVVAVIILLTAGIVAYYFWGVNSEVVITYDGGKITRGEYEAVYRYWAPNLAYSGYDVNAIKSIMVDQLLLNKVLYAEAVSKDYKITDEDKKTIDDQFTDKDSVAALNSYGINIDVLKEYFYKNAVLSAYLKDVQKQVTTTQLKESIVAAEGEDADLALYHTSHILFAFTEDMTDAQKADLKKKAEGILTKVKAGEDFAELAKNNSDDSGTASDGGKYAMSNNDSSYAEYQKAVLTLKAGAIYPTLVETNAGFHIIKLNSIEKDGRLTAESEIEGYVDDLISKKIEATKYKTEDKKIDSIVTKINSALGIAQEAKATE